MKLPLWINAFSDATEGSIAMLLIIGITIVGFALCLLIAKITEILVCFAGN